MRRQTNVRRNVALTVAIGVIAIVYAAGYVWLYQQAPLLSIVLGSLQLSVIAAVVISGVLQRRPSEELAEATIDLRDQTVDPPTAQLAPDLDNVASLAAARAQRDRRARSQPASNV